MRMKLFKISALALTLAFPLLISAQENNRVVPESTEQYAPTQQPTAADFSDEEITKFSKVVESITELQTEAEQEIIQMIEAEGMDVDDYNRVAQAHQAADQGAVITDAERETFTKVNEKMQEIQMEMQPKLIAAIEEQNLEIGQYQNMLLVYQQDPNLQQMVKDKMEN